MLEHADARKETSSQRTRPAPRDVATRRCAGGRALGLIVSIALAAAACAPAVTSRTPTPATSTSGSADAMQTLVEAAQAEGALNVIALPHDVCNYGEVIKSFADTYDIAVNELNPEASFGDAIDAIRANQDNPGPQAPDVVDVGFAFGAPNVDLFQRYKVATWDSIPDAAKDPDGAWYGDHYGMISFTTNADIVVQPPTDWSDLLNPRYKGQIALDGDPHLSNQAVYAVYAAALANGGSLDDAQPGLDFFRKLVDAGVFVPVDASPGTITAGTTPIALRWSYSGLSYRDATGGDPTIAMTIPRTGRLGGTSVQAISRYAPHPNAAKLWMEYLYSDAGQLLWLKGYCHPIRYDDMVARGAIPDDQAAVLPDSTGAVFPTPAQLEAATNLIEQGWDTTVGIDIRVPPP